MNGQSGPKSRAKGLSAEDDAKLVFGTIFSLRNMVRKLGGPEDKYVNLSSSHYRGMLIGAKLCLISYGTLQAALL